MSIKRETTKTPDEARDLNNLGQEEPVKHTAADGATMGGAAVGAIVGAVVGSLGGPVGAVVGGLVGGAGGGFAGQQFGNLADQTSGIDEDYWRNEYPKRPYYDQSVTFDKILPAYRAGADQASQPSPSVSGDADAIEAAIRRRYESIRPTGGLDWERVRAPAMDAYHRGIERQRGSDS